MHTIFTETNRESVLTAQTNNLSYNNNNNNNNSKNDNNNNGEITIIKQ